MKDPVHFDFINNDDNDKWLQPGKNKWIPNIDDPVGAKTHHEQMILEDNHKRT